jgi:hypothetical protein
VKWFDLFSDFALKLFYLQEYFFRLCFKVYGERWVIDFKHAIQNFCAVTGNFKGIHFMHPIARASAVTGTIRGIHFMHLIYLQRFCSHWKLRD